MEFIKLQSFKLPSQSINDKTANNKINKRTEKNKITAIKFASNK